jgi:tRNA modification GTPase
MHMAPTQQTSSTESIDPICGLSTARGLGGIAIIRMSGGSSILSTVAPLFRLRNRTIRIDELKARYQYCLDFVDDSNGEIIDDVLMSYFPAPKSYTGEHLIEVSCHGSMFIVEKILSILYRVGLRAAKPGEFTYRAYLNGKLDLAQAEGIGELIHAQSDSQWQAAKSLARGQLSKTINELANNLLKALAILEAKIDFPEEHDVARSEFIQVEESAELSRRECLRLIATFQSSKVALQGLSVVIIGLPNVGKSTLLNTLLDSDRAIVSEIPGTTRDYIEEKFVIDGRMFRLIDTAGIRAAASPIERHGIERSLSLAKDADVIVFLASPDQDSSEQQALLDSMAKNCKILKLASKADLGDLSFGSKDWIQVSAKTSVGYDHLKQALVEVHDTHLSSIRNQSFIASARHFEALTVTINKLDKCIFLLRNSGDVELAAFELKDAARSLEEVIGRIEPDNILEKIFGDFCVGK